MTYEKKVSPENLSLMLDETRTVIQPHSDSRIQAVNMSTVDDDTGANGHGESKTFAEPTATNFREREKWGSKVEFILACMGFSVGLGNVWRFPYLAYKNGGGAFFIPYLTCLICGGVPLYFLEVALGQYTGQGGITAWQICPLFRGIGYGTTIVVFYLNIFYVVILAWAVLYLYYSFASVLPWASCDNEWNTDYCYSRDKVKALEKQNMTFKDYIRNLTGNATAEIDPAKQKGWDAANEFWQRKILNISSGIHEIGTVQHELAITLFIAWVLCYFCVWKGVKSSGKVVYFTATFPYIMLTILLVRGVTLDGALDGIIYYLNPDFSRLLHSEVWIDAGTQIFFSYAVALGCIIALGSYNDFHNNFYKDCIFLTGCNCATSVFAGFVVFSVLGFMSKEQGVDIKYVAESGPGLAFIAYPKAVAQMELSPLWAVLFFFMIIILGIDSQFVGIEGFVTAIVDLFPNYLRYGYRREIFIACVCLFSYFLGLFCVTNGGIYVFELMNYYSASGVCLLWICFFESIAIAWVYGAHKFYDNIQEMVGYRPNPVLMFCWRFLTPTCCMGVFLFSVIGFKKLTYNGIYEYPDWAVAIGWSMALSSMVCIPFYMVYAIATTPGTIEERLRFLTTPQLLERPDGITKVVTSPESREPEDIPMNSTEQENTNQMPPSYDMVMGEESS